MVEEEGGRENEQNARARGWLCWLVVWKEEMVGLGGKGENALLLVEEIKQPILAMFAV